MTDFEKYGNLANDMYHAHNLAAESLNEWKTISSVHKSGKGTKIRHIQKIRYILANLYSTIEQDRVLAAEAFAFELQSLVDTIRLVLDDTYSKVVWQKDYITLQKSNGVATVSFPIFRDNQILIYGVLFRTIGDESFVCFQSAGFEIMMAVGSYESCYRLDGYEIQNQPQISENESHSIIDGLNTDNPMEYGFEPDQDGNFTIGIGEDMAILTKHFDGVVSLTLLDNSSSHRISQATCIDEPECTGLVLTLEENPDLQFYFPSQEEPQ